MIEVEMPSAGWLDGPIQLIFQKQLALALAQPAKAMQAHYELAAKGLGLR